MKIRLTQLDGKFPNLALMRLSHFYKMQGAMVYFKSSIHKDLFEPKYDLVFASAIFSTSKEKINILKSNFPDAIIGGTGSENLQTVENFLDVKSYELYDYSIYPNFKYSIGFSQRGCRLHCKFCVVPSKEGKVKSINTLSKIWRGNPYPKNIILLDNDFFGQKNWKDVATEAIKNDFKISFSQGINIRLVNEEQAVYLSQIKYYDNNFKKRTIYTAWDNKRDEKIFLKGINHLLNAGVKPCHIMVYFLCNYWEKGLTEDVWHRFNTMKNLGLKPYPMIFDRPNVSQELKDFQRWVIRRNYKVFPFSEYQRSGKPKKHNPLIPNFC